MNDNRSAFSADEYDRKIKMTIPFYEEFYKQVIDIVKVYFDIPVKWLDIGCGTGKMAETVFVSGLVIDSMVLCDNSQKMLETARKRFHSRKNVKFIDCSILEWNEKERFDVVTAMQVFHYFDKEERISAIQKCYDALCENGIFVTFENFAPVSQIGREIFLQRWKSYQLSQGKPLQECEEHIARYGEGYFPITIKEHMEILEQCGFRASEVIWVSNMQVGLMGIK